jgi:type I restriction-modification system DNA methylase subunit
MTEQKQKLEQQLWNIANTLRGKMDADDFRDYILGFIFYKYLSRKMKLYGNTVLKPDGLTFDQVEGHAQEAELMEALKDAALDKLGYFLAPDQLFSELARRGNAGGKSQFILGDLAKVLNHIEQSTMGTMASRKLRVFSDEDVNRISDTYHHWRTDIKTYEDEAGYAKSATLEEIAKQDYKLTPGIYVGTEAEEDDGIPFEVKMTGLKTKLAEQFEKSNALQRVIEQNFNRLN